QAARLVVEAGGRVVASRRGGTGGMRLSPEGLAGLGTGEALVGDAYWDGALGKAVLVLAVPIREADGRFLAALAAKLNLHAVADILQRLSPLDAGDLVVATDQGRLIIRPRLSSAELMRTKLPERRRDR